MAGFSNTEYRDTISNLLEASKSKINNPYYIHTDKQGTIVDYYAQNKEMSTLDPGSVLNYSNLGQNSPLVYNVIRDFILYGINRAAFTTNEGDEGTTLGENVTDDAYVLPNTVHPTAGDYFTIKYLNERILFKITEVGYDTLDTGANAYNITYQLQYSDDTVFNQLEAQIDKEYRFIAGNVGTDHKAVILSTDFDLIKNLELLTEKLTRYFKDMFFDDKVQTFIYRSINGSLMYDIYFIEFMIRNRIFMNNSDQYTYVTHQTTKEKLFNVKYDRTIYKALEDRKKASIPLTTVAHPVGIDDMNTLFAVRAQTYYQLDYMSSFQFPVQYEPIDPNIFIHIQSGSYYSTDDERHIYNPWIAYFNNDTDWITSNLIGQLNEFYYQYDSNTFYSIPVNIFIIYKFIKDTLL